MEKLVLENKYTTVVPLLFGAASAAPNKGTTLSFGFRSLSTVLSPAGNRRNQGLFELFSSTFQGIFNFQDFSRKPSKFKYFSSLCKPWYS